MAARHHADGQRPLRDERLGVWQARRAPGAHDDDQAGNERADGLRCRAVWRHADGAFCRRRGDVPADGEFRPAAAPSELAVISVTAGRARRPRPIHGFLLEQRRPWMPGTRPGMTTWIYSIPSACRYVSR